MNILVACERVDAEGGTESYVRIVVRALIARGHSIRIVARNIEQPDAYGADATALHWSDEHDPPSVPAASAVTEIARRFTPDVVAVHNVLDAGVIEALQAAAPRVVYHLHDHRPFCPNGDRLYPQGGGICGVAMHARTCGWHALVNGCAYGPRVRTLRLIGERRRVAVAIRACDATIALSHYMRDLARRNAVPPVRLHVVPPPLEPEAFAIEPAMRPTADVVLFAARVMPSKGGRPLVRALAGVAPERRPTLHIAGEGPDLATMLDEARIRGVRARALGRLDAAALRRAYDEATLVAMPSLWGEPFGLVGIEALARGRPVAAFDAGAIAQWLPSDAGRLAARGDEAALAHGITELLEPTVWPTASAAAFRSAHAYSLESHVEALEAIYANVS